MAPTQMQAEQAEQQQNESPNSKQGEAKPGQYTAASESGRASWSSKGREMQRNAMIAARRDQAYCNELVQRLHRGEQITQNDIEGLIQGIGTIVNTLQDYAQLAYGEPA